MLKQSLQALKERFKSALGENAPGISPATDEQISKFSEGLDFPIDFKTGAFTDEAFDVALSLKTTPPTLFGFDETTFKNAIEKKIGEPRIVFEFHRLGITDYEIAKICGFTNAKVKNLLRDMKEHIQLFCYASVNAQKTQQHKKDEPLGQAVYHDSGKPTEHGKDEQKFLQTGIIDNPAKFMTRWNHLSVRARQTSPAIFLSVFKHFFELRRKDTKPYPKREIIHIVDRQILDDNRCIRPDMTPDVLAGILSTYASFQLSLSTPLKQALETLIASDIGKEEKFINALRGLPICADLLPNIGGTASLHTYTQS